MTSTLDQGLCASLFYFRLPHEQWRERLDQVARSGYSHVDVYIPWNFHEITPGVWDFTGARDVGAFLDLAHEAGLRVLARPGPYICSEWDGGALPAWLTQDPRVRLRQNEPAYLEQVSLWFDQIMPQLASRQVSRGGPVALVQLENELDFFDCLDRAGYMSALRDLARARGIEVPLVACSGQGDIRGATGGVEGIVPTCNFYPDDASPDIEPEVRHYAELMRHRGLPLMITETNRVHRTLRRLFASGATFIAPYLQASGWNFGPMASAGNWGSPGSFMTHDYDFDGYTAPTGKERPEFFEGKLLAATIAALGSALHGATPSDAGPISADVPTAHSVSALTLASGGQVLGIPNLGEVDGTFRVPSSAGDIAITIPAQQCPLVWRDVPLASVVSNATSTNTAASSSIVLCSTDITAVESTDDGVRLVLAADGPAVVVLRGEGVCAARSSASAGGLVADLQDAVRVYLQGPDDTVRLGEAGGYLDIAVEHRGVPSQDTEPQPATQPGKVLGTRLTSEFGAPTQTVSAEAPTLESLGVYRGRGRYTSRFDRAGVIGLAMAGSGDIIDVSLDGNGVHTFATFGALEVLDLPEAQGSSELRLDVQIWGHSNFDDHRLPMLRMGAQRGIGRVWAVESRTDVTALWQVSGEGQWAGTDDVPIRILAGWSSTRSGVPISYSRAFAGDWERDRALIIDGLVGPVRVSVSGRAPVTVDQDDPWVLIPRSDGEVKVSITMPHGPSQPDLSASLLTMRELTGWSVSPLDDRALAAAAAASTVEVGGALPLTVQAADQAWVHVQVPASQEGFTVHFGGHGVRLEAWFEGRHLGRVWLAGKSRPAHTGGRGDYLWLPGPWTGEGGVLRVLLNGCSDEDAVSLETLTLRPA